jgi:hypothetical protein
VTAGFVAGSVVWAKFESFPYWPALVSELESNADIDAETRMELDEQLKPQPAVAGGAAKSAKGSAAASKKELVSPSEATTLAHSICPLFLC